MVSLNYLLLLELPQKISKDLQKIYIFRVVKIIGV